MTKKIFEIRTKDNTLLGELIYNVFAENILDAIKKVQDVLENKRYIDNAKYLCDVDEDEDLEEYKKEIEEDAKI